MTKKQLQEVNDIIGDLTELETVLARHIHYVGIAEQPDILNWFEKLHKTTSRLNNFYKNPK